MQMRLLLLLIVLVTALALAPPHPGAEDEVHEMHRALQGSFDSPRLVNAALCKDLTEEECFDLNREFELHARKLRLIYQTTGYLKVLVVLVRFSNHADRALPTPEQYHGLFNSPGPDPDDVAETGSIKNYLEQNSIGSLEIDFGVMPWKTTDNTEAYYSFDNSGVTRDFGQSLHAVMDQLEADGVDWSQYDLDGDGKIDAIVLLHSGYQAEIGNADCYTGALTNQRIWSHAIAHTTKPWTSPRSGISTDNYAVGGGMRGVCHNRVPQIGVITHELLHNMGLPDLNDNSGDYIGQGLGHYSIMSNPYGINNFANFPCHLTPWEKIFLGWLEPIEIETDGDYSLRDSETSTDVYVIKKNFQFFGEEYFLIENRQPKLFDELLWSGGLMIWHIDDTQRQMRERGYPGQEGWPSNNKHYQIALLAPDGRYDIDVGRNRGDAADFWHDGMEIGPGLVEEVSTDAGTYPNTNSYQFGLIAQTGIRIHGISPSGDVMSFSVEGLGGERVTLAPTTSTPTHVPTWFPTVDPTLPPTLPPTVAPTPVPIVAPTDSPTLPPTLAPILVPIVAPTDLPTLPNTVAPTPVRVVAPTDPPTLSTTVAPTPFPIVATTNPLTLPATVAPTPAPVVAATDPPTLPPTVAPTHVPVAAPTDPPSPFPTKIPTTSPTSAPTYNPSSGPSRELSNPPTLNPTTGVPSTLPSYSPSFRPSMLPSHRPSASSSPSLTSNVFDRQAGAVGSGLQTTVPTVAASCANRMALSFVASLLLFCCAHAAS